jgi:hypothetical protein
LKFIKEEINNEINYLWNFSGYKSLAELLLDFRDGREIGILKLKKSKGSFSEKDIKEISTYVKKPGNWIIRVFIRNKNIHSNLLHLAVPIELSEVMKTEGGYEFRLISGSPALENFQFSPV